MSTVKAKVKVNKDDGEVKVTVKDRVKDKIEDTVNVKPQQCEC